MTNRFGESFPDAAHGVPSHGGTENGDAGMSTAPERRNSPLATPSDLGANAVRDVSGALTILLADVFSLYLKTKNFHWHMSGLQFRDYHLMLDEQGNQIFAMTDAIA